MNIGHLPPKAEMNLEDLFTAVYGVVEESYRLHFTHPAMRRQSHHNQPVFTDAEVLAMALVGELQGEDSQRAWHGKVNKSWRSLFPCLGDRTRYGRSLRRLRRPMAYLQQPLCFLLGAGLDRYRVVDSFPLSLCHMSRVSSSTQPFEYYATIGYCTSKKEHYYGMTIQLLCDLRGIPTFSGLHAGACPRPGRLRSPDALAKITAFDLAVYFNHLLGEPLLQIKDFAC